MGGADAARNDGLERKVLPRILAIIDSVGALLEQEVCHGCFVVDVRGDADHVLPLGLPSRGLKALVAIVGVLVITVLGSVFSLAILMVGRGIIAFARAFFRIKFFLYRGLSLRHI